MRWIPIFSILLSSSSIFAGLKGEVSTPCSSVGCRERCFYEGNSSYGGGLQIETRYIRQSESQESVRTLVRFSAKYLFWRVNYFVDEEDLIDLSSGDLKSVAVNIRYLLNGKIKRQRWDHFEFDHRARRTSSRRVQGKEETGFRSNYPRFALHWPVERFGDDWLKDYDAARPESRPDLDTHGFSDSIASPLYLAFFKTRFLEPSQGNRSFEPFLGEPPEDPAQAQPMRLIPNISTGRVIWSSDLYVGGLRSPEGKPAKIEIDPKTRHLTTIHLFLEDSLGSVEGQAKLMRCELEN